MSVDETTPTPQPETGERIRGALLYMTATQTALALIHAITNPSMFVSTVSDEPSHDHINRVVTCFAIMTGCDIYESVWGVPRPVDEGGK